METWKLKDRRFADGGCDDSAHVASDRAGTQRESGGDSGEEEVDNRGSAGVSVHLRADCGGNVETRV